jgi:hypothetical protein
MHNTNVSVVIPVYSLNLNKYEWHSITQIISVLGNHPIIIVKPESLDISSLLKKYKVIRTESFDDSYFKNICGYNKYNTPQK